MPTFAGHHIAVSVRDLHRSMAFYQVLGFRLGLEWVDADGGLTITHMVHECGLLLEMFEYADNRELDPLSLPRGNDTHQLGVRHVGFRVDDLEQARRALLDAGYDELTDVKHGRTGIDYFFVKDPDGVWVELVEDRRELDADRPVRLVHGRDTG